MTTQSTPAPGLPELPKLPDLLNRALEAIVLLQTIRCHPRRHDMERSWLTDADRVIGYWEKTRTAEAIRVHLSDLEAGRASRAQSEWQPIETAPKDGRTMFVVRCFDVTDLNFGARQYTTDPYCVWPGDEGGWVRWPHVFPPTHWTPLPATLGETK